MRTTLDLDADLLKKAMQETGAKTKTEVIELGLQMIVQGAATKRLMALAGKVPNLWVPPRRRFKGRLR
jgi:Arc/MetJ family transcription regulator